jgi:uncharacterized membrane protein YraQ (UPF0718 family)
MKRRRPDRTTLFLIAVVIVLAGLAWLHGGFPLVVDGLSGGASELLQVTPLLLAAFLIAGLTQVLISRDVIERWLGSQSGWRGILLACLGGALIPGGPYVYYPIAGSLLHSGAGLGVLVAFVSAKNLWSVTRLPYEFALLGPRLTLIRYAATFLLPPIFGFAAEALFGPRIESIREALR